MRAALDPNIGGIQTVRQRQALLHRAIGGVDVLMDNEESGDNYLLPAMVVPLRPTREDRGLQSHRRRNRSRSPWKILRARRLHQMLRLERLRSQSSRSSVCVTSHW